MQTRILGANPDFRCSLKYIDSASAIADSSKFDCSGVIMWFRSKFEFWSEAPSHKFNLIYFYGFGVAGVLVKS